MRLYREIEHRRQKERELAVSLECLKRDLSVASRLQRNLLPANQVQVKGLKLEWFFETCDDIGGELINYFPLNDREVALVVVDVAGHGISAALNAMAVTAALVSG